MVKTKKVKTAKKVIVNDMSYAIRKNYSLRPREPLSEKDVAQLFITLNNEKKETIQY